jgi:hypothetical protein
VIAKSSNLIQYADSLERIFPFLLEDVTLAVSA